MRKAHNVSVRVTGEQKDFLENLQVHVKEETGIEVPLGAVVRMVIERVIQQASNNKNTMVIAEKVITGANNSIPNSCYAQ